MELFEKAISTPKEQILVKEWRTNLTGVLIPQFGEEITVCTENIPELIQALTECYEHWKKREESK